MSKKIQFQTFNLLFRLFSYLADKSGGWSMFVRPKLVIGGVIVGLGMTACDNKTDKKEVLITPNQTKSGITDLPAKKDTVVKDKYRFSTTLNSTKFVEPQPTCYDTEYIETECYMITPPNNFDSILSIADETPEFIGKERTLNEYLSRHIHYPNQAIMEKIEGMVICRFIVNKDGSISDIIVLRGTHPLLDSAAVRAIQSFPNWNPGKHKGKPVRVYYTLPIKFAL